MATSYQMDDHLPPAVSPDIAEENVTEADVVTSYGTTRGIAYSGIGSRSLRTGQMEAQDVGGSDVVESRDSEALLQDGIDLEDRYQFDSSPGRLTLSQDMPDPQPSSTNQPDVLIKQTASVITTAVQTAVDDAIDDNSWLRHAEVKKHWRAVCGAFTLLFMGTALLLTGVCVAILPYSEVKSYVFIIVGFLLFIPGAYHVVYMYLAVKGKFGLTAYNVPLFQ